MLKVSCMMVALLAIMSGTFHRQMGAHATYVFDQADFDQAWADQVTEYSIPASQQMFRQAIFRDAYIQVMQWNSNPTRTFNRSINKYSHWTQDELKNLLGEVNQDGDNTSSDTQHRTNPAHRRFKRARGAATTERVTAPSTTTPDPNAPTTSSTSTVSTTSSLTIPAAFDWTDSSNPQIVHAPKDQGQCGSCWAFASVGVLEGAYAKKSGTFKAFSEQMFVDCSVRNGGCNGGNAYYAFNDLSANGSALGTEYPYTASASACSLDMTTSLTNMPYTMASVYKTNNSLGGQWSEEAVKEMLWTNGPLYVSFEVVSDMYSYSSGIYETTSCTGSTNHAVLLVGWGTDSNGRDFWRFKNSWGVNWGDGGYAKMPRDGSYLCEFAKKATYVDLS